MKSWRPDNWAELRLKFAEQNMPTPEGTSVALALLSAMEVGADAILEARPPAEEIKIRIIDTLYGGMSVPELETWLKEKLLIK